MCGPWPAPCAGGRGVHSSHLSGLRCPNARLRLVDGSEVARAQGEAGQEAEVEFFPVSSGGVLSFAWPATPILGAVEFPAVNSPQPCGEGGCVPLGSPTVAPWASQHRLTPSSLGWDQASPGRRRLPLRPSLAGASGPSHEQPTVPWPAHAFRARPSCRQPVGLSLGWTGLGQLERPRGLTGVLALSCCAWGCSGAG